SKYETLSEFLEHAALMMTEDDDDKTQNGDAVNIMTIHAAKGLEFDTVFMPAWEEDIFPNKKAAENGGLEEERRLAYVALTRARKRAVISSACSRMIFGKRDVATPSRFIGEIDKQFVQGAESRIEKPIPVYKKKIHTSYASSMVGKLVKHSELGSGVVIEENDDTLTVAFKDKGIKKVAKKFVAD
ncbi:MAG: ATP-binding domain-containing protein, partial [Alphaproteobacteria bacterium]|nr:ATP-binding domain-containing protein [Alphaproteobacteria bacterium]